MGRRATSSSQGTTISCRPTSPTCGCGDSGGASRGSGLGIGVSTADRDWAYVRAWLFRVCANLVTSRGRRGVVANRFLQRATAPAEEVAAEVEMLRHETGEALAAALAILPADSRAALVMAANGYSGREIADALGRTESATRTMMFRARERLRTFLVAEEVHG